MRVLYGLGISLPTALKFKWKTVHLFWDMDCLVVVPDTNKDVIARLTKEVQKKAKEVEKTIKEKTKDVVVNAYIGNDNKKSKAKNNKTK